LSVDDFSRKEVELIYQIAKKMPGKDPMHPQTDFLKGKVVSLAFFEPSTRTRMSFEIAQKYLGGGVVNVGDLNSTSIKKGESLDDTLRIMGGYTNSIIIRTTDENLCYNARELLPDIPIINAGNGSDEHPTQALLDLWTIKNKVGSLDNLTVGIIGDLKYGRTTHSLAKMLNKFENNTIYLFSPKGLEMPEKYKSSNCIVKRLSDLSEVVSELDVLYATRIQKERISNGEDYSYRIDKEMMNLAKEDMILMHPLPRIDEIPISIDLDKRAAYFEQARGGLVIRQALLYSLLRKRIIL